MKKHWERTPKPRDPSSHARAAGMLKQQVIPNKKRVTPRKSKHQTKGKTDDR